MSSTMASGSSFETNTLDFIHTTRRMKMTLLVILFLCLFALANTSEGISYVYEEVNNTIKVPEDKKSCSCSWSPWMSGSEPDDMGVEDETFTTLRSKGYHICPSPVDIQCYSHLAEPESVLELGFSVVCAANLGLKCSIFCDDYSIRVACCYCPPDATGPEFQIASKSGDGCLKANPTDAGSVNSAVAFNAACDFSDKTQSWVWVSRYSLKNMKTQQCLAIVNSTIVLENCDLSLSTQKWKYVDRSSTLQLYGKSNSYLRRDGTSVLLGSSKASSAQWLAKVVEGKTSMKNMKNFKCLALEEPENGALSCSLGEYVSSKCTFSCKYGYKLPEDIENPSVCTDDDGLFTVDSPACEKIICHPAVDSIEHGTVTCSNNANLDSSCIYKCDAGYALIGSAQLTCAESGEWNDAAPTCERVLCSPDLKKEGVPNGSVNCTNAAYYGSKCTYTCLQGFEMVGPDLSTCQMDATWDLSKPVCNKIQCPAIVAADNCEMSCTTGTDYLSACKFTCDIGYTMVGSATSVCAADKTWGSEPPTCERKTCNALPNPENGDMFCDDGNFYDSKCSFTCDRGFKIEGEESLKCTDEGWNFGAPICTQITCIRRTNPVNGVVSCTRDEIYGSVCSYNCSNGFKLLGQRSTRCSEDGWNHVAPTCEQITCRKIPNPKNGKIFCSKDNHFGTTCFVYCNTGYDMPEGAQQAPISCQLDGLWSNTPATCKRIQCRNRNVRQGIIMCSDMNNFNSTCTFSCKEGYNLLGASQATCKKTGWDAQAPSCGRLTCSPPLARPSNGQIKCSTSGRPICTFSCDTGYELLGSSVSECQEDKSWSVTEVPICEVVKCPKLPRAPSHSNMTCSNGQTYNSICGFECNAGYNLVGEQQTRCNERRAWDQETPTCEKIFCSPLDTPTHGSLTCSEKFFYKSKCDFRCGDGYVLVGQRRLECYYNSTWSLSPPYCKRITCGPSYTNPSNGRVGCSDGNNYNSVCTFACEDGFSLEGTAISMCETSGWTVSKAPMCKQITCPMDNEGIPNGSRRCDRSNLYKSHCEYNCNQGYELVGAKNSDCAQDGSWSREQPICREVKCPKIPKIENGQVICHKNNMYKSECRFVCNGGFVRVPDIGTVKCMVNKRWNPAGFPACEVANITVLATTPTTTTEKTTPTTESTTTSTTTDKSTTTSTTKMEIPETTKVEPLSPVREVTKAPNSQMSVRETTVSPKLMASTASVKTVPNAVAQTSPAGDTNSEKNTSEEGNLTLIIGAVVGAVALLLIILLVVIILWRKRSRKKTKYHNGASSSLKATNRHDHTELGPLIPNGNDTGGTKYSSVSMDRLEMEYNRRHADDDKLFREEYHSLVDGPGSKEAGGRAKNKDKNRYTNILPYDHSRVILPKIGIDADSDYINASFVDGYKHKGKFIAAQGPKENTINDFWRMVWEQNVSTIIMATNLEERKELKCAKYWPQGEAQTYGDLVVSHLGENHLVDYTIRTFSVRKIAQGDSTMSMKRNITQYHFTSWPDFGVPKSPSGILKFLRKIKHGSPTGYGPTVVHCSAGVGRTGTFICIDAMMDMISRENKIDVYTFSMQMRQQRPEMVQTEQQYIFIYQAILEHHLYGDTEVEASEVSAHIEDLMQRLPGNVTGMEHEFKKLTSIRIQKEHMRAGNHPANMRKNRVLLILPYDWNRVMLPIKRGQENTDYINASYIDGYRQKDAYIATQGPLPHTTEDFWRMIWNSECASIVMLTELVERGQAKCAQYWPNDGSAMFGDVEVELVTSTENEDYSERDFRVSNTSSNARKELLVKQFHYHGWPEVGAPVSGYGMIELVEAVQKQQQNSGNHPIVIHCSAGAGRTGAFCALATALEQVKAECVLDMFQIVKCLRMQRPHMVQNLEQYEFCYRAVQEYIDSMSEYYNFK